MPVARLLTPRQRARILLTGVSSFVPRVSSAPADISLDFTRNRYYQKGKGFKTDPSSYITCTRNLTAYADNASGAFLPFAANVPRITNKGLSVWEARTNSLIQSAALTNAAWGGNATTVTAGQADPASGTSAALLVPTAGNAQHLRSSTAMTLTAAVYTWSVFFKAAGYNFGIITAISGATSNVRFWANVNLTTGAITNTGSAGSPTNTGASATVYPNGWVRLQLQMSATADAGKSILVFGCAPTDTSVDAGGNPTFVGDGASGALAWQPQVELGSFASPPNPTTSAAVLCPADVVNVTTLPSTLGPGFTFRVKGTPQAPAANATTQCAMCTSDGTNNNTLLVYRLSGLVNGFTENGGVGNNVGSSAAWTTGVSGKSAIATGAGFAFNGAASSTASPNPATQNKISLGGSGVADRFFNGYVEEADLWAVLVASAGDLQRITT